VSSWRGEESFAQKASTPDSSVQYNCSATGVRNGFTSQWGMGSRNVTTA